MRDTPRHFESADHLESILMAVQPREEHDAGLIEIRRRLEDMARKWNGRRETALELVRTSVVQCLDRCRGSRSDRVENPEQSVAVMAAVTADHGVVVEIVTRVHADAGRQAAPELDLALGIQQGNLDPIQTPGMIANQVQADFRGAIKIG